jgi:hypothetical protein
MKSTYTFFLSAVILGAIGITLGPQGISAKSESIRGWLSDEQCARGRAEAGTYTQKSGRCAKECVAKGKKIVLIDPDGKRILLIANQEIAKKNVGDYVEVSGEIDPKAGTIQIGSLRFLDKNCAMCGVEPKKKP